MSASSVFAQYGWKFLPGGGIVVLVTYLSNIDRPMLAGLAVLFPTITLTSYFLIGYSQGVEQMRAAIPASLYSTLGFLVLSPVMYVATYQFNVLGVITLAFLAWLTVAGGLLVLLG